MGRESKWFSTCQQYADSKPKLLQNIDVIGFSFLLAYLQFHGEKKKDLNMMLFQFWVFRGKLDVDDSLT